jgi:hypothetical protein
VLVSGDCENAITPPPRHGADVGITKPDCDTLSPQPVGVTIDRVQGGMAAPHSTAHLECATAGN